MKNEIGSKTKNKTKNKTKSKTKNKKQGFTLVEVIVVAVIVLVLSAVAIPMYNGYVRQARQDVVNNLAETAAAEANAHWRRTAKNMPIDTLKKRIHYDSTKHTIEYSGNNNTATAVNVIDKREESISKSVPFR